VVGVFKDQPVDEVNETAEEAGVDLVQLSGGEWSDGLLVTRQAVKVVSIDDSAGAGAVMSSLEPGAALAVMLDSSHGTARMGDWDVAAAVARRMPIWLAGGLTPENVSKAVERVRPWLVDVSTGVETGGVKDPAKISAFINAVRARG
jgi:phosphoribosylanthranilate isomerase